MIVIDKLATVLFALTSVVAGAGALVAQDSMQLADGRFVVGPKMSPVDGGVTVHYENGDVFVPKELIKSSTAFDAAVNDANWTAAEKAKLARGLVPFEGTWMKAARRDQLIEKRRQERAAMIADAMEHSEWINRHRLNTAQFAFEYTIDPEVMKELAEMMEVYYKTFTKEWGIRKPSKMGRLKVTFYHDQEYYQQVSGSPPGVIGYFRFVEPLELAFFYDRLDPELTVDVMFHEANHYLTHLIDPKFKYPSWVNESLAEYYGASEWDPVKKKMDLGFLQEGRLAVVQDAVKKDDWQGLEDMIRLERFSSIHYAWGWTFVHYLLSTPRYEKRFKKFYLGLARDRSIKRVSWFRGMQQVEPDEQIRALKKYLGVKDLETLEKEWHAYVKSLKLASARGYEQGGKIALGRGMPIKAQRLFKTALEMGSTSAMTHFGYGKALLQKNKVKPAIDQFEQAIAKDPLNGLFRIRLARAKALLKGADKQEVERLRRLAVELEPDNYTVRLEAAYNLGRLVPIDGGK